jgi:hypothetical protein
MKVTTHPRKNTRMLSAGATWRTVFVSIRNTTAKIAPSTALARVSHPVVPASPNSASSVGLPLDLPGCSLPRARSPS